MNIKKFLFIFIPFWVCVSTLTYYAQDSESKIVELEIAARNAGNKWTRASIENSIDLYDQAANQWKSQNNSRKYANCLIEIGRLNLILGRSTKARQNFFDAIKAAERQDGKQEISKAYSNLSLIILNSGQISQSQDFLMKALSFGKASDSSSAQAAAYFSGGEFYYFQRNASESVKFHQKSVEFAEKTNDSSFLGQSLLSLGYAYMELYQYDKAQSVLRTSLLKSIEANDIRLQAMIRIALGFLHISTNEKQNALDELKQAETLFPTDLDRIEKARLLNGIGAVYEQYGEWKISLRYREQALKLFDEENYSFGKSDTFPALVKLSYLSENKPASEKYLAEGIALTEKLNDELTFAFLNEERGNIFFEENSFDKALSAYKKAETGFLKRVQERNLARIAGKIGKVYLNRDEFILSEKYLLKSLDLNQNVRFTLGEAESLYLLAKLNYANKNYSEALDFIENSIVVTESLYLDVFNAKLRSTYFSSVFERYELYINLLMKKHQTFPNEDYALQAIRATEKSRARSILENISLSEAYFTKDANVKTVQTEKELRILLNAKADKLTDLLSQNAEKSETEKISNEINELNNELENIKAQLKQQSPVYSAIKNPAPFDVEDFQQNVLDENSLLLEFSFGKEESYLWLVGKNEVSSYVLPPRAQIESRVETLRILLQERSLKADESVENFQARMIDAEKNFSVVSKELSNLLFGQIAGKLAKNRLIIVPDGELHYFPVAALPNPESANDEPILLTNETIYAPSAQTLLVLTKNRRQSAQNAKNLLIFSDPIFTLDDARFSSENQSTAKSEQVKTENFRFVESLNNLPRLAASNDESEEIKKIVGESETDSFSGFAATRENLLNLKTENYRIVHFATHGLTDEKRPELSGIVFSRFSENGQKLDEFFRIQDIYALNLNADLVVLSACETGTGKEVRGEGLMSLNNAFLQTGAKTVMASLWKVEDGATLELMKHFYEAMASEKLTPSQSLRQAQIKLRDNPRYRSPFYWAAFTVQGDFKNTPQLHSEKSYFSYALLATFFLTILFFIYRIFNKNPMKY